MSLEIPENMDEVVARTAMLNVAQPAITQAEVINEAIVAKIQGILDEALGGRYDVAQFEGNALIVRDVFDSVILKISPINRTFADDFRENDQGTLERIEDTVIAKYGHR